MAKPENRRLWGMEAVLSCGECPGSLHPTFLGEAWGGVRMLPSEVLPAGKARAAPVDVQAVDLQEKLGQPRWTCRLRIRINTGAEAAVLLPGFPSCYSCQRALFG